MSNSYLLISSAYRNRLLYPNPADFVIPFGTINNSNSSLENVFVTTNPVSFTLPDYNFCFTNYGSLKPGVFMTRILSGTATAPIFDEDVNTLLLGIWSRRADAPNLSLVQESSNCYGVLSGLVLRVPGPDGSDSYRDIIDYDPSVRMATLRNPIPGFDLSGGPLEVFITDLSATTNPDCPTPEPPNELGSVVFVNGKFLENSSNVYFDYSVYLYDVTLNEIVLIQKYQSDLRVATLCQYFSCAWSVTDQYWVMSRKDPMALGSVQPLNDEDGAYYNIGFIEDYTFLEHGDGYRAGDVLVLRDENGMVGDAGATRGVVTRVGANGSLQEFRYSSLSSRPYRVGQRLRLEATGHSGRPAVLVVRSTSLALVCALKQGTYRTTDFVGNYFMSVLASPQYSYDPETHRLFLSPNNTIPVRNEATVPADLLESQNRWGVAGVRKVSVITDDIVIVHLQAMFPDRLVRFDIIRENLDQLPTYFKGWDNVVFCQFSQEGVVPLNFTGTSLTQSQMSCYEMTAINLILPNQVINSTLGLLTSAYPYVFLEISNETMPSGHNRGLLYSNNPSSVRATFVCSISDVNNPVTTRFIKISSDGATQVMKFSPFDNLRVRVSLPNGRTFLTERTDTLVPCDPDPTLQVSTLVQFRRLS